VELCLRYKTLTEEGGFRVTFSIETSFVSGFGNAVTELKSTPFNVATKPRSLNGKAVAKLGDTAGKNSGDSEGLDAANKQLVYMATLR
jgi:nicotinic acid phosphoribosyltransferase